MAKSKAYSYRESLPDAEKDTLGKIAQAPSAGNAWGAIVAPTLDPTSRPDVLNADKTRSSLLSASTQDNQPAGREVLYPSVSTDGRILSPDEAQAQQEKTGQHLGIYSTSGPEDHRMADQAAIAMHEQGAQQMLSPSYVPTAWTRADQPGISYPSQAERDLGQVPAMANGMTAKTPVPDDKRVAFTQFLQQESAPTRKRSFLENLGNVLDAAGTGLSGRSWDDSYSRGLDQQYEQDQAKDPNSAASKKARQASSPMLKQLGFKEDELAQLSAADIAKIGGPGHFVENLIGARQTAAQNKLAQEQKIAAEERAAVRAQQQAEYTGNTTADKERRANIIAGNAQDQAVLQDRLATEREAMMQRLRSESEAGNAESRLRLEAELRAQAERDKRAYEESHPKAGFGAPLKIDDIEGTGWKVEDPASAERIINKRALTKETLHQLADAKTSIDSLDRLIANRKKYGSNALKTNQGLTTDNTLWLATAKQNYIKAMGMPNTNESQQEVNQLFPDPNAIGGSGAAGMMQGVAAQAGMAGDPVLEQLLAARDEAVHNLRGKIPIPSLKFVGGEKINAYSAQGELGKSSAPKVPRVSARAGTKLVTVRAKDGSSGQFQITPQQIEKLRAEGVIVDE